SLESAIIHQTTGERNHVVGDRSNIRPLVSAVSSLSIVDEVHVVVTELGDLLGQGLHARQTGTGDRLVGGDMQLEQTGGLMEWLEHRHGGHGGAVRVGDDALGQVVLGGRVDLGNNQ